MKIALTKVVKKVERRSDTRLDLSLPITLFLDQTVKTISKNICAGGVSFVIHDDELNLFPLGKIIRIEIVANIPAPRQPDKTVTLTGNGLVIRNNETDVSNYNRSKKKLCIALQFTETLKVTSVCL